MKNIHLTSVLPARARGNRCLSLGFPWALELPFCAGLLGVLALAMLA